MKIEKMKVLEVYTGDHRKTITVFAKVDNVNMHYNIIWNSYASIENKICYQMTGAGVKTSRQKKYSYFEPYLVRSSDIQHRKEMYLQQIKDNIPTEVINFALEYLATKSMYVPWSD